MTYSVAGRLGLTLPSRPVHCRTGRSCKTTLGIFASSVPSRSCRRTWLARNIEPGAITTGRPDATLIAAPGIAAGSGNVFAHEVGLLVRSDRS